MSRPIFTQPDGVMREYINDGLVHDGGEPHRAAHVVSEDEEARAIRTQPGQRHSIQDAAHAVLADAEVEVASAIAPLLEIFLAGDERLGRRRQVSRAA